MRGNDALWVPKPGPGGVLFLITAPIGRNEEQLARESSVVGSPGEERTEGRMALELTGQ